MSIKNTPILLLIVSILFSKEVISTNTSDFRSLSTGQFDANRIHDDLENNGMIVSHRLTGHSGMEWPAGENKYSNFASGVWFAGIVNGEIRTAVAEYGPEFVSGPWGSDPLSNEHKLYKVNYSDLNDPAFNDDFQNWPTDLGAPWVDNNSNGIYEPLPNGPDHPHFIGEQVIWYVMNDGDVNAHTQFGSEPLGLEVRVTLWGNNNLNPTGDMMFIKLQAYNKGGNEITDMFVGLWDDPDLGDADDDYVGCDIELSLGYCYNDGSDSQYGAAAPAIGYDFFQAAVPSSDPTSSAFAFGEVLSGYEDLPMSSFVKYINGDEVYYDPETSQEVYNYMSGLKADGSAFVNSATGEDSKFVHPCDPNDDTGSDDDCWVDGDDHDSADRRFLMNVGPFTFSADDSLEVVFGIIHAQANDALSSVTLLKQVDQLAQLAYDIQFALPDSPPSPSVTATATFEQIILTWDDSAESYISEDEIDLVDGESTYFEFEGYNVWQLDNSSGTGDKALLATYDVVNGLTEIYDNVFDPNWGVTVNVAVQSGTDSGLRHWLSISSDKLNGGSPLINDREYYFSVNAYGYNPDGIPNTLESADNIFGIRPQNNNALIPQVEMGYSDFDVTHAGPSDGSVTVTVIDPFAITGDDYQVYFEDFYVDWETGVGLGLATGPDCAGEYVLTGETLRNTADCNGACQVTADIAAILGDDNCDATLDCAAHLYDNDDCVDSAIGGSCFTCSTPPCIQDCSNNCVDESLTIYHGDDDSANGDGNCDDGSAGLDLDCEAFNFDHEDCVCFGYTINLVDAYGDGWNGAELTIGTETFGLEVGAAGVGCYNGPTDVEVTCSSGDWPSEVSWTITDVDGLEVLAGGAPFTGCLGDCDALSRSNSQEGNYNENNYLFGEVIIKYKSTDLSNPFGLTNNNIHQAYNDNMVTLSRDDHDDYDADGFLALGWNILNVTTGEIVLENQTIQGGFNGLTEQDAGITAYVVDGLEVVVNGPANGIHGIYMIHDGATSHEDWNDLPIASALQEHVWINYPDGLDYLENSNGGYYFATQGGGDAASEESYYARVFRGGNFDVAIPNDFEMRFTESGSKVWMAYSTGSVVDVPFELWNIGDASDPSDDFKMISWVYDTDGTDTYSWSGDLEDSGGLNDPGTDWVYWRNPSDTSPGTAGYDACAASDSYGYDEGIAGTEVMARTVWNNWNGYGSVADSVALVDLSDTDPANWTAADTTIFTDRGWFFDSVNSLAGVTAAGDYAYGTILKMPATGSVYRWITNKPNAYSDQFAFSTSDEAATGAVFNCEDINVWPNPYFGQNVEEVNAFDHQMHFTGLPPTASISIFNLNGVLVRKLDHTMETIEIWDVNNSFGIPVASGMYIAHVDTDACQAVLKLAIVNSEQRLDRY